jgi:hypothetical protein
MISAILRNKLLGLICQRQASRRPIEQLNSCKKIWNVPKLQRDPRQELQRWDNCYRYVAVLFGLDQNRGHTEEAGRSGGPKKACAAVCVRQRQHRLYQFFRVLFLCQPHRRTPEQPDHLKVLIKAELLRTAQQY